jgi:serine phosphatase RsbU (regulator of sigma subunit)/anti-sigma regulatory factor (Ser/Thr protein kinase)
MAVQIEPLPALRPSPDLAVVLGGTLRFRRRVLVGALLAGVLFVCVAAALAWRQYDDARTNAVNDARTRVILAATIFDQYFGGELTTLGAIAQAPPFRQGNGAAMSAYLERVEPPGPGPFGGGLGWSDNTGILRLSTNGVPAKRLSVADRSYFKHVMTTGSPYVSEGVTARGTHKKVIIMAVPTHDLQGRISGVLAGAMLVNAFDIDGGSLDLGFTGYAVLDRSGRELLDGFAQPRNPALARRLRTTQIGLLSGVRGLDGGDDHLVAYSTAATPGWTIVIDRSRSAIFAAARHGLMLELALIAAVAGVFLCLIGWLLVRGRREAERQAARARQRDELSHALGAASYATEVARGLAVGLATAFPDALAVVALEPGDRLGLELAAVEGAGPASALVGELIAAAARAYETGTAFAIEDDAHLLAELPELHAAVHGRVHALHCAPLRVGSARAIGALCLVFAGARVLDENERAHVAWYADETALALDRARSFEHEHTVAVSLQRSLLSQDLPSIDGVELFGRYQAGSAGMEVGGDWYDVIRRSDGLIHITVGDVAGRGIPAAVLMGQLRHAFRAYAYDHVSPAELLRRMRRHVTDDEMATAVCMTLDPYTQELTYASAGHPPSLLAGGTDGPVMRLDRASAPPLGFAEAETIREADIGLHAPATIVAYTDGMIERRGWSIDVGIDLLADVVGASRGLCAQALAGRISHEVAERVDSGDDIALLIVRLVGVPRRMDIEIPSDPAALAGLRRRLRGWLTLRGLDAEERDDAVLSISEACNNAIEHGYQGGLGTIRLILEHRDDELGITIEDHGQWRTPTPDPERGRGIRIMRAVMSDARVEHASGGGTRVTLTRRLAR